MTKVPKVKRINNKYTISLRQDVSIKKFRTSKFDIHHSILFFQILGTLGTLNFSSLPFGEILWD